MDDLWKRIKKRILLTISAFRADYCFSLKLAVYRMLDNLCWRFGFKKIAEYFHQKKDAWIIDYLQLELQDVIEEFKKDAFLGHPQENAPIWVCWWTGEETAPDLVKQCIKSIRINAGVHPVYLIDKNNYMQYLNIPEYILEKVSSKQMGLAHLADYIRVSLLALRGGLWLDATIFCAAQIPESCFDDPFFTCRSVEQPSYYLSKMRWVTFILGGWKENLLYRYLQRAFEQYWKNQPTAIDYLMFDAMIELAHREIPEIRKMINAVPENNLRRDDLQAAMNRAADAEEWNSIVQPDTVFYKLSWRESYAEATSEGKESIFGHFIRKEIMIDNGFRENYHLDR